MIDIFNKKKLARIEKELADTKQELEMMSSKVESLEKHNASLQEELIAKQKPPIWFELTGHVSSDAPAKGVAVEMDWSDEFVDYLLKEGLTGKIDEELVKKWLLFTMDNIITELEEVAIEHNTENAGKEFM